MSEPGRPGGPAPRPIRTGDVTWEIPATARWSTGGAAGAVDGLGLGDRRDLAHTESRGVLAGGDPAAISARARDRGRDQLGTLGAGNGFLEIGAVGRIAELVAAAAMGRAEGGLTRSSTAARAGSAIRCARTSFSSASHGAGRRLSRHAARRPVTGAQLRREREAHERAGIARRVARLVPVGVLKG